MSKRSSKIQITKRGHQHQEILGPGNNPVVDQTYEFKVLKCIGKRDIKNADGSEAIQFMFSIHLDDPDQTTFIHEVNGQNIPIVLCSLPIMTKSSLLALPKKDGLIIQ